ncbi:MAG: integrase domain-containing protein [Marinobacter sp.]|nr:integrase domain-containing protein [Marinobacter sp.]
MSRKTGFNHSHKKRNFGLGAKAPFAAKTALRHMYGHNDHYQTRAAHHQRFRHFLDWLSKLDTPIKDLRKVTLEMVEQYAGDVAKSVKHNQMTVAYAQNLLSTINIVMLAARRDRAIWLSPSNAVGARSYIRTIIPDATDEKIEMAVRLAEESGNHRGAALIIMSRAFGLRLREASLADLFRLQQEAEAFGEVQILDGTKGGRKSSNRTVAMGSRQYDALKYAMNTISEKADCLVDTNASYKEFISQCINPMSKSLKQAGIRCPHDLRAERLIERYEEESGQAAPVKQDGSPFDRDADLKGRKAVQKESGHGRISVAPSYVGKRHRKSTNKQQGAE